MTFKPYEMPMTDRYIVVPLGEELELRREAVMARLVGFQDGLLGREIIWVETLGL